MEIRNTLPLHAPVDAETRADGEVGSGSLDIRGGVMRPGPLSMAGLSALPRERLTERFACEEGWAVEGLTWQGIPLRAIVALCEPLPEVRYVRVCAGHYWLALPLADLDRALLCDTLNEEPLSREHGAPWRLVVSGGACFTSVKWVDRLELTAEAGAQTAERIARDRLSSSNELDVGE